MFFQSQQLVSKSKNVFLLKELARRLQAEEQEVGGHKLVEEPTHHRMVQEPAHHRLVEEPAHHRIVQEPAHHRLVQEPTHVYGKVTGHCQ